MSPPQPSLQGEASQEQTFPGADESDSPSMLSIADSNPPPVQPLPMPTGQYTTVIDARVRRLGIDVAELWRYRDLLFTLALRDLKLRYRQTALGPAWVVLQPLISAAIFAFVFGKVAHMSSGTVPYFVLVYAGMLAWNVFSNTVNKATSSVLSGAQLVSKIYFPRILLPLSTVLTTLTDCLIAAVVLAGLMMHDHLSPGTNAVFIVFPLLLALMLGLGIGLTASALVVHFRDVGYLVPLAVQLLLYASPVAYTLASVPARYQQIYQLNPLCGILELFRWACLGAGDVSPASVFSSIVVSVVTFAIGLLVFRSMEDGFADVI